MPLITRNVPASTRSVDGHTSIALDRDQTEVVVNPGISG